MDGVLIDLLNAKWNTFVKSKFYKQFFTFAFYFLITLVCFTLRPGPPTKPTTNTPINNTNTTPLSNSTVPNLSTSLFNNTLLKSDQNYSKLTPIKENATDEDSEMEEWWDNLTEECRLMKFDSNLTKIRLTAEVCMLLGAFAYLLAAVREARFLGGRMFFENLVITFFYRYLKVFDEIIIFFSLDDCPIESDVSVFLYFNAYSTSVTSCLC